MAKVNYEDMSDHDLLVEMLKAQRKDARRGLLAAISGFTVAGVFAVAFAILIPIAINSLANIDTALKNCTVMVDNAQITITKAQTTLENIDTMTSNVNTVVVDNTESVNKSLDEISKIDIEKLNKAIDDLSSIIEPLAKLFGNQ